MQKNLLMTLLLVAGFASAASKKAKEFQKLSVEFEELTPASLQAKHPGLHVRVVVGRSQPLFVKWAPESWSPELDSEEFSGREAFGRMLCPGHPRNPLKTHLILVRADAPSDTLWHEYMHYLQAQRDADVCALYARLEQKASDADLRHNDALEFEVQRWVYEAKAPWEQDSEARIANLEALGQLTERMSAAARENIEKAYGWSSVPLADLKAQLKTLADRYVEEQKSRYAQAPKGGETAVKLNAELKGGVALLASYPADTEALPLCVNADLPAMYRPYLIEAIEVWNSAGRGALGKPVLAGIGCAKPAIVVSFDEHSGATGDAALKLGELLMNPGPQFPALLRVRARELEQYRWMLAALARQAVVETPVAEQAAAKTRLDAFTREKSRQTLLHFFTHELGHALGLGHNFSPSDASVMGYDVSRGISEYDTQALRCRFQGKCERGSKALLTAPQGQGYPGS